MPRYQRETTESKGYSRIIPYGRVVRWLVGNFATWICNLKDFSRQHLLKEKDIIWWNFAVILDLNFVNFCDRLDLNFS